jgi:hypothetical protein
MTIEHLDEGLDFTTRGGKGCIPWGEMSAWRQDAGYLLIQTAPHLIYIIPKTIATQGFDCKRLADDLQRHVGPPL